MPELKRIGHKGADIIAPGNTTASFDAALEHGVDMIEFDVLPEDWRDPAGSRLLLAHDYTIDLTTAPTLEEGLEHLAAETFGDVELDVDLKLPGYEDRVVRALEEFGLVERTLISTMERSSLQRLREIEPRLRLGWSVPKVKRDYTKSLAYAIPALAFLAVMRRWLPGRAAQEIREGRVDAIMAHWRLITPRLIRTVREAGGELYVWTVDDAAEIGKFQRMGVTGVITNDPRLFSPSGPH